MGRMKDFIMQVSCDMGHYGEINDEVLEAAQEKLAGLLDRTYDELNDPELAEETFKDDERELVRRGIPSDESPTAPRGR